MLSRCRHGTALPDCTSSWLQEQIYTVSIWYRELAAVISWGLCLLAALRSWCGLEGVTFVELHASTAAVLEATHAETIMELQYRSPVTTNDRACCMAQATLGHTLPLQSLKVTSIPKSKHEEE